MTLNNDLRSIPLSLPELSTKLQSMQDCEQRFLDLFGDGCNVKVEPFVQAGDGPACPSAGPSSFFRQSGGDNFYDLLVFGRMILIYCI